MRINYNVSSIIARNALNNNDNRLSDSIQRLSSGLKINKASDDSAGLAISVKMNAQIRGLERAEQNANDGVSVVNTVDGAMAEMQDILQRMNELAIQAANGTNANSDREQIQLEIDQLVEELDRIAETTEFNAQKLMDGSFAYKGYTNTENVKVLSYSDSVTSGTYAIDQIIYNHYEDVIKDYSSYIENSASGKITTKDYYAAESADQVKNALITSASVQKGLISFPNSTRVEIEDENIIIKGENNFELTLTVNDRNAVTASGATTTTSVSRYNTNNFQNITVVGENGTTKYTISELNIIDHLDDSGNIVSTTMNTGSTEEGLRHLGEDLKEAFMEKYPDAKDISVVACTYATYAVQKTYVENGVTTTYTMNQGVFTVTIAGTNKDGTAIHDDFDFSVSIPLADSYNQEIKEERAEDPTKTYEELYEKAYEEFEAKLPDAVHGNNLNYYMRSHTETERTTYTVGEKGNMQDSIILDVTGMGAMRLQVGANEGQVIQIEIPAMQAYNLGVDDLDITTEESATEAIDVIGEAINKLSGIRAKIGAYSNRIEHTIKNLDSTTENMTAAYSRIMDVDMATEMTEYSTVQVLVQSSTAMLAQANERPQSVLQLLQ